MYIHLENGETIEGRTVHEGEATGELVFTTAYTGYEESLTDPSYNGQALIFAYPLIGNYGVDERRFESDTIHPNVAIAREFTDDMAAWFAEEDIPAVDQLDTRRLVQTVREEGSLIAGVAETRSRSEALCDRSVDSGLDMTYHSPIEKSRHYGPAGRRIVLLDCGVKRAMIEQFAERGAHVIRVPWTASIEYISRQRPDLLFVSNGPGNPADYEQAIETVQHFDGDVPIAGICLGQQIITLALGGSTRKMKFGHRGANQPVYDTRTEQVRMTTQNHSYEVDEIPDSMDLVQYNVNDESPEGLVRDGEIICRQYHPEAHPGPRDSYDFFDNVLDLI